MPSGVYQRVKKARLNHFNKPKDQLQLVKVKCLKCLKNFLSDSKFIRICKDCKKRNEGVRLGEIADPMRSYR